MLNADNTNISNDARVYKLPVGYDPKLITTASQALPVGTIDYGFGAVEGETFAQSQTQETVKSRNKQKVVRQFVSDATATLAATFLEEKKEVRELYHGGKEDANGRLEIDLTAIAKAWYVYDSIDDGVGYEKNIRFIFEATTSPNGDLAFAPGSLVQYPVLFTIIGNPVRITEVNGVVVPEDPTDPVDPNPTTYPAVTNITTQYIEGTQTLQVNWDTPNVGMDDFISGYTVNLEPVDAGTGATAYPSGNSAMLSPVSVGEYQLTVSYGVNGLPQQHGATAIPVTIAV
jgi:hypothetical protein